MSPYAFAATQAAKLRPVCDLAPVTGCRLVERPRRHSAPRIPSGAGDALDQRSTSLTTERSTPHHTGPVN